MIVKHDSKDKLKVFKYFLDLKDDGDLNCQCAKCTT